MDIQRAIERLLTPDGAGRKEKGEVLIELCQTFNANLVPEEIEKFFKSLPYGEKV
jgi:hypothetical protein